jgi:hypothetical protein
MQRVWRSRNLFQYIALKSSDRNEDTEMYSSRLPIQSCRIVSGDLCLCGLGKSNASYSGCSIQSTESPIFDAPFWSENWVSCPHERNKIGDSVLWLHHCPYRAGTCRAIPSRPASGGLQPDPEIPDWEMFIRARNAVWMTKRTIGIRGFWGLLAATKWAIYAMHSNLNTRLLSKSTSHIS